MFNIFTIIISLFLLISCSDDKDTADTLTPKANTPAVIPLQQQVIEEKETTQVNEPEANILEEETSEEEDAYESNKEWDVIVTPQDSDHFELPKNNIANNSAKAEEDIDNPDTQKDVEEKNSARDTNNSEVIDKPTFQVNKNDIVLGNPSAKVVLIEYYSPTCPHCAYYNKTILPQLKTKYIDTNQIAYVIREFIGNKYDLDAAILQRCPKTVESFLKFQKILLDSQEEWSTTNKYRELLIEIGGKEGLSKAEYEQCLKDDQLVKMLLANTNLANSSPNFMGTPAFFINAVPVTGGYKLNNLIILLDKALGVSEPAK